MSVPTLTRNGFELTSIVASRTLGVTPAYGPPGPKGEDGRIGGIASTGWGAYFNTAAAQVLTANVKVTLANNVGSVIETQKPADVPTFYNGSVIPGRDGDGIAIGVEFVFTPSSAMASVISVAIDIGGAVGELYLHEYPVLRGLGSPHKISYNIAAYMLNTWAANGGLVKVVSDGPGSIGSVRYVIQRLHEAL